LHPVYFFTNEFDQYSRIENVRIFGMPEDYTVEDNSKKPLLKLAGQLNIIPQEKHVQRIHRLGKRTYPKQPNLEESLLVLFHYAKKQEFIKKVKKLKGTKIAIYKDLTSIKYKLYTTLFAK